VLHAICYASRCNFPTEVSLRIADLKQLCSVEIMIRGIRDAISLTYSQTQNEHVSGYTELNPRVNADNILNE
jgi:hypothetical protein